MRTARLARTPGRRSRASAWTARDRLGLREAPSSAVHDVAGRDPRPSGVGLRGSAGFDVVPPGAGRCRARRSARGARGSWGVRCPGKGLAGRGGARPLHGPMPSILPHPPPTGRGRWRAPLSPFRQATPEGRGRGVPSRRSAAAPALPRPVVTPASARRGRWEPSARPPEAQSWKRLSAVAAHRPVRSPDPTSPCTPAECGPGRRRPGGTPGPGPARPLHRPGAPSSTSAPYLPPSPPRPLKPPPGQSPAQ